MPEEARKLSVRPDRSVGPRLGFWSRVGTTTIGLAGLGSGAVAVFVTHLEAGPVGLLAAGFLLFMIGVGGRMPSRLKVGDNEAEWQEEREAVQEFVERVAVDSQEGRRADLVSALDELAMAAPGVANPALSAMAYEALVLEAIAELSRESEGKISQSGFISVGPPPGPDSQADAILEAADGTKIAVEIKGYRSGLSSGTILSIYGTFVRLKAAQGNIRTMLLISRTEVRGSALEVLSRIKGFNLLVLGDVKDTPALKAAIDAAFDVARALALEEQQGN